MAHHNGFPEDIVPTIIDFCRDDAETLINCSKVCTSWTFTSHRYLFRCLNIHVTSRVLLLRPHGLPEPPTEWYYSNTRTREPFQRLGAFCEFLKNSAHAAKWIKSLRLSLGGDIFSDLQVSERTTLCQILLMLMHVVDFDLDISTQTFAQRDTDVMKSIVGMVQRPTTSRLFFRNSRIERNVFLSFLSPSLPGLKHLGLTSTSVYDPKNLEYSQDPEDSEPENSDSEDSEDSETEDHGLASDPALVTVQESVCPDYKLPKTDLEVLHMELGEGPCSKVMIDIMTDPLSPIGCSKLRHFHAEPSKYLGNSDVVDFFLHQFSLSLTHLEIREDMQGTERDLISLDTFPNLRSLHFTSFRTVIARSSFKWVIKCLKSATYFPSGIEELCISLDIDEYILSGANRDTDFWGPCRELVKICVQGRLTPPFKFRLSLTVLSEWIIRFVDPIKTMLYETFSNFESDRSCLHTCAVLEGNKQGYGYVVIWGQRDPHGDTRCRACFTGDVSGAALIEREEDVQQEIDWGLV